MKKSTLVCCLLAVVLLPNIAFTQVCIKNVVIDEMASRTDNVNALLNALSTYDSCQDGNTHTVRFMSPAGGDMPWIALRNTDPVLQLVVGSGEAQDVILDGLRLKMDTAKAFAGPLFTVSNTGAHQITLQNSFFEDVHQGILFGGTGSGLIEMKNGHVYGHQQVDTCIALSTKSHLDQVEVKDCSDGVKVGADDVVIKDSTIKHNVIGVHILDSYIGTSVEHSKVYFNLDPSQVNNSQHLLRDDGVRFERPIQNKLTFLDYSNGNWVSVADDGTAHDYADRKIVIQVPSGFAPSSTVEFYLSDEAACKLPTNPLERSYNQACGYVLVPSDEQNPTSIDGVAAGKVAYYTIPSVASDSNVYKDKAIVAVFKDALTGTTGISQPFRFSGDGGGVVAFVATPYDIPTSGGVTPTSSDTSGSTDDTPQKPADSGNGNSIGGTGVTTEGGGDGLVSAASGGGAAGVGAKCTLIPTDAAQTVAMGLDLWWLLLAAAVIGSLRAVRVRARRRR